MKNTVLVLDNNYSNTFTFSKHFKNDYLNIEDNPILLEQPILITNILFQIMLDLKDKMFHTDDSYIYVPKDKVSNQTKLSFWHEEVVNNGKNEIRKVYKTSQFLKNRNKLQITNALDFLKKYKNEIYSFENKNGVKITTSGGLIKDWYFHDKTGKFEITLSLYWAHKIVTINKGFFNSFKINVAQSFKNVTQRFFVLYLMQLKRHAVTTKDYKSFMKSYNLDYPNLYELKRGFFASVKGKLDNNLLNNDWISFNYFDDEKNKNNICFYTYEIKPKNLSESDKLTNAEAEIENKKYTKRLVSYKLKQLKRRHKLDEQNTLIVKNTFLVTDIYLFNNKYELFKKQARKEKRNTDTILNNEFMDRIKKLYL